MLTFGQMMWASPNDVACFASKYISQHTQFFAKQKFVVCCETKPYTAKSNLSSMRSSYPLLKAGTLAAHRVHRLMLLGPPSDMVHSSQLRKTRLSTQRVRLIHKGLALDCGIHPCCSGFQVQGSAKSPAGMALFHSTRLCYLLCLNQTYIL